MKNKSLLPFLAGIMLVILSACSGGDVAPENPTPTPGPAAGITIPSTESLSHVFEAEGGSSTLSFSATETWTATVSNNRADAWCSVEPTSGGKGNHMLVIKAKPNEDFDDKSATIQLKSSSTTKTINVTLKQKNALTLTSDKFELSDRGGEFEIEIKANVKYSYTIDEKGKEWISFVKSRALNTTYLLFKAAKNESDDKREAEIKITDGKLTETVKVYQSAAGPAIVVTQNEYAIASEGEEITVEVASNVDVEVQMPNVDWIKDNDSRAYSTHTYHYIVSANETYDNRQAVILFKNKENNLEESVTIIQAQKDAIVIAEKEYIVPYTGGNLDFKVSANVDFKVDVEGEWMKQVTSRGLTEKSLYFDVAENTSDDSREGKIILTGETVRQEIVVTQKGKTSFAISSQMVEVGSEKETFQLTVTSNIGYKIEPYVDWIKEVESRAVDNYVHTFEVSANPTTKVREGVIVVCNDEEVCIPVTVRQKGSKPVETGWEDKEFYHRSQVLRFTADWCGYCPNMAENIEEYQKRYPDKLEAISIHGNGSNLMFEKYAIFDSHFGITGYPTGIMDMRRGIYSWQSMEETLNETEKNYPTQTGIGYYSELKQNQLSLDVQVYAKAADKYKVTIILVEDNIIGYQSNYETGAKNDYVHMGVARVAVTDALGDDCTTNKKNEVVKKHYDVTIPNSYKIENMRVVVYVQRPYGNQQSIFDYENGGYYVDNCASGKLGSNLKLATIENASSNGNEDIVSGEDINI